VTVVKIENMALRYEGEWTVRPDEKASLGCRHESGDAADACAARWEGYCSTLQLYACAGPQYGIAEVWVDGKWERFVDLYDRKGSPGSVCVMTMDLAPGFHTVDIQKSGRKHPRSSASRINIDYILAAFVRPKPLAFRQIVCIGDSITFGANVADRPKQLFGRKLQQMLFAPVSVHGLSGAPIRTIASVLDAVAVPRNPDLILWLAGMNDQDPYVPMRQGIDTIRELMPETKLVVSNIPYNTYYTPEQNETKAFGVMQACRETGVPCADLFGCTQGNRSIHLPEGTVHPNADGHTLIASLFYSEIIRLLQS